MSGGKKRSLNQQDLEIFVAVVNKTIKTCWIRGDYNHATRRCTPRFENRLPKFDQKAKKYFYLQFRKLKNII